MATFAADLKPSVLILGGDALDCAPINPHDGDRKRRQEGLRLLKDMEGCKRDVIERFGAVADRKIYMLGNHEAWIDKLIDETPALEGLIGIRNHVITPEWELIEQGGSVNLGKLHFIHGDQIPSPGMYPARKAVESYEKNIRFGHFHRAQLFSKISALDSEVKTGMSVPALCRRNPLYLRNKPNQWSLGFLWGYVEKDGSFNDYLTFITNERFSANGRTYKG